MIITRASLLAATATKADVAACNAAMNATKAPSTSTPSSPTVTACKDRTPITSSPSAAEGATISTPSPSAAEGASVSSPSPSAAKGVTMSTPAPSAAKGVTVCTPSPSAAEGNTIASTLSPSAAEGNTIAPTPSPTSAVEGNTTASTPSPTSAAKGNTFVTPSSCAAKGITLATPSTYATLDSLNSIVSPSTASAIMLAEGNSLAISASDTAEGTKACASPNPTSVPTDSANNMAYVTSSTPTVHPIDPPSPIVAVNPPVAANSNNVEAVVPSLDDAIRVIQAAPETAGSVFASRTTVNSPAYNQQKKKLLAEFIQVLKSKSPKYDHLLTATRKVHLPSYFPQDIEVPFVFVLLSGSEHKPKKVKILNDMLIDWVSDKKKKYNSSSDDKSPYPVPSTLNTMIRAFFAAAKDQYQWDYSPTEFKFDGGYTGFFKTLCKERQRADVSIKYMNSPVDTITNIKHILTSYHFSNQISHYIYHSHLMV